MTTPRHRQASRANDRTHVHIPNVRCSEPSIRRSRSNSARFTSFVRTVVDACSGKCRVPGPGFVFKTPPVAPPAPTCPMVLTRTYAQACAKGVVAAAGVQCGRRACAWRVCGRAGVRGGARCAYTAHTTPTNGPYHQRSDPLTDDPPRSAAVRSRSGTRMSQVLRGARRACQRSRVARVRVNKPRVAWRAYACLQQPRVPACRLPLFRSLPTPPHARLSFRLAHALPRPAPFRITGPQNNVQLSRAVKVVAQRAAGMVETGPPNCAHRGTGPNCTSCQVDMSLEGVRSTVYARIMNGE